MNRTPIAMPSQGPVFQSMEDSLEKLKVLDYETRYCQPKRRTPLDRTYFALPAKNPSVQLQNFLDIVAWLIYEATGDDNLFKASWRIPRGMGGGARPDALRDTALHVHGMCGSR